MLNRVVLSVLGTLALTLSGCGAMLSPVTAMLGVPYGGTRWDCASVGGDGELHPAAALVDLPFALTLDTVFLPLALLVGALDDDFPAPPAQTLEEPRESTASPWNLQVLDGLELARHPRVVELCGEPVRLEALDYRDSERLEVVAVGHQGTALIRVQRWAFAEACEVRHGLHTTEHEGHVISLSTWDAAGARVDLLRPAP